MSQPTDAILNLLKPPGMTSHDAVHWLRRTFGIKKAGHTGTLDPDAAGVLPLCIGKATKVSSYLTFGRKIYRVECQLGKTTDTLDGAGVLIGQKPLPPLSRSQVEEALKEFTGPFLQVPPAYSAIKIQGRHLYDLARQGKLPEEIQPRPVEVFSLSLLDLRQDRLRLEVVCSGGFYVRSLVRDLAERLGTCGYMLSLIRLGSGPFILPNSVTLEELAKSKLPSEGEKRVWLTSLQEVELGLPSIQIRQSALSSYRNGVPVSSKGLLVPGDLPVDLNVKLRVLDERGTLLGIGRPVLNQERICLRSDTLLS